jgi:hypothetical protein
MYSYYQNGGKNLDTAEKELLFSLSKAYDLYNYLLLLMVEETRFAFEILEQKEQVNRVAHKEEALSHRFVDNKFIAQLESNKQLCEFKETKKWNWKDERTYLKSLYEKITEADFFQEYMSAEKNDYDAALYGLLLNGKKGTFSRHVLAVSLLYCLYGRLRDRKDEKELTCKLINKLVACLNKEWPKKTDIQNDIIVYLKRSKKTGFPSLSNYYDFRQHMNVFKRINIWLNFLAETYNIRCEDIKNVERKIIPCYV